MLANRDKLSWFETKPLFGWRVLVPRTKEQAGALSEQLRRYGAVPVEVPTISAEPPDSAADGSRDPGSGHRSLPVGGIHERQRGQGGAREVRGVWARRAAMAGLKVAAVGDATAASLIEFGVKPELVPTGEQSTAGLLAEWQPYDAEVDPIDRVFLPRADIATESLVAGLQELGWEVDDVTAYRTVRAAPPPRRDSRGDQDRRIRRGVVHLIEHGSQPGWYRR